VVLYEALAGAPPNADKDTLGDLILAICMDDPVPIQDRAPGVSYELAAVVAKSLARQPDDRFASAADMYAALASLSPGGTALSLDMMTSLPEATRSFIASHPPPVTPAPYVLTPQPSPLDPARSLASPFASTASMPEGLVSAVPAPLMSAQAATGGAASSTPTPTTRGRSRWPLVLGAVVVLGGTGVAYEVRSLRRTATADPTGDGLVQIASPTNTTLPPLVTAAAAPPAPPAADLTPADSGAAATAPAPARAAPRAEVALENASASPALAVKPKPATPPAVVPTTASAAVPPPPAEPAVKRTF